MVEQTNTRARLKESLVFGAFYAGFFVLIFLFSAYLTFPYDRLRDLIVASASTSGAGASRSLQIGDLRPIGLSGVRLKDVELVQEATAAADPPSVLRVSELSLQVSPWALLFGEKKVELSAKVGLGSIEGKYGQTATAQHIQAELAAVDIAELGLGTFIGMPLKGKASGTIDLNLPTELPKSTGTLKLEIKGLHIGDGKAKIKIPPLSGGLTLEEIDAGKLEMGMQVQDGIATLTRFATDGRDLKLTGKGTLRLAEPIRRSRPDMTLDLTFSQAYKKRDRAEAMFLFINDRSEWQRATTPEGTMHVHVTGTLQALRGAPGR
jgi:type II secretion system protein N